MAENVIDTLSLEIESDSHGAEASIDKLANSLKKLQSSVSGLGKIDLTSFSQNMKTLIASTQGFNVESIQNGIAALKQLASLKSDNMINSAKGIKDMSEALKTMSGVTIPSLDGVGALISNLAKFGGASVTQATNNLPKLSQDLVNFVSGLNGVGSLTFDFTGVAALVQNISRLGGAKATEAAKNLKPLKDQLLRFISGLNGMQALTFDISGLSNLVSAITKLGGASAAKAVPNITNLAIALKQMMATLSTAPKVSQNLIQMTTALAQLANSGGRVSNMSASVATGLGRIGPAAAGAKKHTLSLAAAFGKFYATYWLVLRGIGQFKKAIDISSDLTEVQNVVDVTFGDMKQKVEDLASTSIQDFGMSELTAKQIASRFQAMGVAMGFAQDEMSHMSIELTKLAADMASFYNVEQEAVAKSLQSVFTGETEPLRKFGLDLTNATLQAWALAQGMDVNVQKMTQAEKAMLRYQYVMRNSAAAIGDFKRTADSWHNTLVQLTQSFQQLGGIVGGVLINAFKPFIASLNAVMQSVIKFARTVANALGAIFGWTFEINSGGLATDFEAAGAGAEEMDKGTGGAAKNLKDINKYIAAWHEVNNMTTNDDTGGGGGGGGGGGAAGDLGDAADAQFKRTESILDKFKSQIDNLYDLGAYIGKVLTDAMNGIDWEKVYQGARDFGTGLAQFLNGLISPQLFGAVGRTIAGALNTAIYAALSFGQTFDWKNFGLSIATGINEFFKTFDFASLAEAINVWAKGILTTMITALQKIEWRMIGEKIGQFLLNIDFMDIAKHLVKAIWEAINGAFTAYKGMLETAPLETAILSLVGAVKVLHSDAFGKLLGSIKSADTALSLLTKGFGKLKTNVSDKGIVSGIAETMRQLGDKLTTVQKGAVTAVAALGEFVVVKNTIHDLITGTGSIVANLAELAIGAGAAAAAMYAALGPAGLAIAAITGLIAGLLAAGQAMDEELAARFEEMQETFGSNVDNLDKTAEALSKLDETRNEYLNNTEVEVQKLDRLAEAYFNLADQQSLTKDEQAKLKDYSEQLKEQCPMLAGAIDGVTGKYTAQKEEIYKLIEAQKEQMKADSYADLVDEYTVALDKANIQLEISEQQYANNADMIQRLQNAQNGLGQTYADVDQWVSDNAELLKEAHIPYEDGAFDAYNLAEAIDYLKLENETLEDSIRNANNEIKNQEAALTIATQKEEEHRKEQQELIRSSAEYQQALLDLKGTISEIGLTLSEDFMENLVEQGYNTSALKSYFDSITEGVAASGESLKQLFGSIGLSLPEELAKQMAGLEAGPQSEAVRIMMGIQSGVTATEPQLTALFSNLGMELPKELISSLASQDSAAVQGATINLLSKIEQGEKLAEGNLIQLFSGIGMTLPNTLIKSMAEMDAPMQKQTIELMSQIAAGHDYSKDELMGMFNELGLELPEEFQKSMESMNDETFQQALDLLGQVLTATDEERGPILEKLNELGIDMSQDAFVPGIQTGTEDAKQASAELVEGTVSSMETAATGALERISNIGKMIASGFAKGMEDGKKYISDGAGGMVGAAEKATRLKAKINSPSKLFAELGKYVVEGFNVGIESETAKTYSLMSDFTENLSSGFNIRVPQLDMSVPKVEFSPTSYDMGTLKSTMQMEMDAKMAQQAFEMRQQIELLQEQNQLLRGILNKPGLSDSDVFNATRRGQQQFQRRTNLTGWRGVD